VDARQPPARPDRRARLELLFGKGGRARGAVGAASDPVRRALDLVRQYDVSQIPCSTATGRGTVYDSEIMKLVLDDPPRSTGRCAT
jgi:hypothetical protein